MNFFSYKVVWILIVIFLSSSSFELFSKNHSPNRGIYNELLKAINDERRFDTMLIVKDEHQLNFNENIEAIFQFPKPKIYLQKGVKFYYKKMYNSEILVWILMAYAVDSELMLMIAEILDYMRQVRIFILALDIEDEEKFKTILMNLCQQYKMTNVLLDFTWSIRTDVSTRYQLLPYPIYHWIRMARHQDLFPQHWRNMHQTSIVTHTDQLTPHSLVYRDNQNNIKINGFVNRFVMLFAEHFNASLKMYKPLRIGEISHFIFINQLVDDGIVDIPMVLDIKDGDSPKWIQSSTIYQIQQAMVVVPCARPLETREIFNILLDRKFFGVIFICLLLLSTIHCFIDYIFNGNFNFSNLLLSDRIVPGVLGQSFVGSSSHWRGLKLIYLVLFLAGLNINTQFSANVNTLLTSPPYHKQLETLADIANSDLKISLNRDDATLIGGILLPIYKSLEFCDNLTEFHASRLHFNSSVGFFSTSPYWKMMELMQQYFTHKVYCTYDNMTVFRLLPWTFLLQKHSPYKEPLDYLIHRVHELGLVDAWYGSTFTDMLKLKQISLRDPNPQKGAKVLKVEDLYWAWMVVVIGLSLSGILFILELYYYSRMEFLD
ncbi:uncharacterized protein LOC142224467 [Haematobia irritans]|uniref:uncharacterized protein LOC142224467 n=1 Tax=Haematobia irritans TaxID=7368 RepID=UPI003F5020C3